MNTSCQLMRYPANTSARGAYWKATAAALTAVLTLTLTILLAHHTGEAARIEQRAEVAVLQARQLLRDANQIDRQVRPVPLSGQV